MSAIAKSYWRSIQRGARTFEAVPDSLKDEVRALARADAAAGLLAGEQYRELIGEDYAPDADADS